ncbi:alpha/beta fold hydrolase [Sinosporangium siamense]|uniref:Alpha/beta hydrolase n=1 Tax=Sinosporangium siamense TaxID=1367973 RepID=A0A919V9H4_9ACTN|nr:alpha/beta fold hydrolase [Sinosporangium siamense]GII95448.1 alpha/beta hydrolase [Sinosporangium siamense]
MPGRRVECGTLTRPLVTGKSALGTIDIAYALVRRTDETRPARNTVMVNPGGPGAPAIVDASWYSSATASLQADHDLLLIDPRGTGVSTPVSCGLDAAEAFMISRAELRRGSADCAKALGPRAEGYTSAATADDFNAVRQKLGIAKVVLYGHSYGTYLLPIYAERHPQTVQSMVLSGAYPIHFDPLGRPSAEALRKTFRRICERSRACDGNAVLRDLSRVTARLRVKPLDIAVTAGGRPRTVVFTEDKLANLLTYSASSSVGSAPQDPSMIGSMPALIHKAARGDMGALRDYLAPMFQAAADSVGMGDLGQGTAVFCNDYPRVWSVNAPLHVRWRQHNRLLGQAGKRDFWPFSVRGYAEGQADSADLCIEWPAKGTARPYVSTGKFPDVPTLVVSGDLDSNTAAGNSRLAAAQFPRAEFLSVPNTGHVAEADSTGCALGLVTDFIRDEKLGDTSCLGAIPSIKVEPVGR